MAKRSGNGWENVGLVVGAVAVAALVAFTLLGHSGNVTASTSPLPTYPTAAPPRSVALLGDSYSGGSNMDSGNSSIFPALLANKLGFDAHNFSVGGSGFIAPGQTNQPFCARVPAVVALQPDAVVVEGGHNDGNYPEAQVQAAAGDVLTRLHAGLPKAKIIVIGPIWPSSDVPQSERNLDADLKQLAAGVGARFVDPIVAGWFSGPYAKLIGSDGTHPTDAGHARIAKLLGPVFAATVPKVAS